MSVHVRKLLIGAVALVLGLALLAGPAAAQDATITVPEGMPFVFDPFDTVVEVGQTVQWQNNNEAAHTVTDPAGAFDVVLNPGDTFDFSPEEAGEINYFCRFHGTPNDGQYGFLTVIEEGAEPPEPREPPAPPSFQTLEPNPADNVAAALAWTNQFADGDAETAILGRDDDFADLLAAGATGLPFLVTPTDELDQRVADELTRLGATTVYVVGGPVAVSEDVVEALEAMEITVTRVFGATRIQTAVEIAGQLFDDDEDGGFAQPPPPPTAPGAIIARAFGTPDDATAGFADSLGASSAGALLGVPVLVTGPDGLADDAMSFLVDNGIGHVAIAGGTAAVPEAVETDLTGAGITFDRLAGPTREGTAVAIHDQVEAIGEAYENVVVASGYTDGAWAQAFGASALGSLVVLANGPDLAAITQDALGSFNGTPLTEFVGAKNVLCAPGLDPAACQLTQAIVTTGFVGPQVLVGFMEGGQETQEASATGNGVFGLTPVEGGFCWAFQAFALETPVVAAHVHDGAEGESGDAVIPFDTAGAADGEANGCALGEDVPEVLGDVLANPADYYINVHTEQFPAGAVRDNLFPFNDLYVADLSGDQEVGEPGAPMAGGVSFLTTNEDDDLCHFTIAGGLQGPPVAAHIHAGGPDENGPVAIPLYTEPVLGPPLKAGCVEDTDPDALAAFQADPTAHYVNVHSEAFPAGAIRGQANPQYVVPEGA